MKWLVAKYMPDLTRREPINVGVILVGPDGVARGRFRATRDDGVIDGRSTRWATSADNYQAHVDYWRHLAEAGLPDDALERVTRPLSDANYVLELGGQRLSNDPDAIDFTAHLDRLYAALVEDTPERTNLSVSDLTEQTLSSLNLPDGALHRDFQLEIPVGQTRDSVVFDYRFDNGAVHLMRNVPLSFKDDRSWDSVHASLWGFERAEEHPVDSGRDQSLIGFVKPREADEAQIKQLELLRDKVTVVDVTEPSVAAAELSDLFGVG